MLSEEEIIKQTEIYINLLVEERKYGTASIEQIRFQETIQGLLNLYNKEKEKNKELKEELDRQINTREIEENFIEKNCWAEFDEKGNMKLINYISKDKIKRFIEDNTKYISFGEQDTYLQGQRDENDEIMDKLQELLEERN